MDSPVFTSHLFFCWNNDVVLVKEKERTCRVSYSCESDKELLVIFFFIEIHSGYIQYNNKKALTWRALMP